MLFDRPSYPAPANRRDPPYDFRSITLETPAPDPRQLVELVTERMPFGKYQGWVLKDLPEPYLVWFKQKGFPRGHLGQLLQTLYEIKLNGLESLLEEISRRNRGMRG